MNSNNSPSCPDRISHGELKAMIQSAPVESRRSDPVLDDFTADLSSWSTLTQQLLQSIVEEGDVIGQHHSPQQMMALGSFRTHLMLSLQALKAAQS